MNEKSSKVEEKEKMILKNERKFLSKVSELSI
jgi:hypothetical protein